MYNLTRINNNYYDLTLYNDTDDNIPVIFDVKRMMPYLYSENSDISIVRFDLNNDCIPVYIPTINTDFSESISDFDLLNDSKFPVSAFSNPFSDATTTNLNIVIQDITSGITSAGFVSWVPEDVTQLKPQIPKTEQETIENKYYYAFNSLHIAVLVENAINEAIQTLYNTLHSFGANTSPLYGMASLPRIKLVLTDNSFFMLFPEEYGTILDSIEINFNRDLWRLFPFYASPNDKLPKKYKSLLIKDLQSAPFGTGQYYTMKLKYNPTSWSKFYRLSLKTNYLPVVAEMTYNSTKTDESTSTASTITDYILNDSTDPDETFDKISFEPQVSSFRPVAINLNKQNESRFQCYFTLKTPQGSEVPLEIEPGRYASIKVLLKQE